MTAPETLLQPVRRLLESHGTSHLSDRELLHRFTTRRDEAAFAALVERHGSMVLGVCRRLLRREQDAEDVFQATFLVLARKAARLRWQESISNWLYGVARRLALKARVKLARRSVTPGRREERTGQGLRHIPLGETQVMRLALSADSKVLAAGIYDVRGRPFILWDTGTGKERQRLLHQGSLPHTLALSPDGKLLATGGGRDVRLWDTTSGKEVRKLRAEVGSLAFSPDGKVLATGLDDGAVKLWIVADGKEQATLRGEARSEITWLAFSPDGRTLAAARPRGVTLWDLRSRKVRGKVSGLGRLAFSPTARPSPRRPTA